jgi:hypothetical protein
VRADCWGWKLALEVSQTDADLELGSANWDLAGALSGLCDRRTFVSELRKLSDASVRVLRSQRVPRFGAE